jgi:beta-galactosidase/beta-glucuronidase
VDYECAIWVNGAYVTGHRGGFDSFHVDVTDFVRLGDNELILAVDDATSAADQPRGKQHLTPQGIWYTPVTGIWQTVWIEQVPRANHIAEVRIAPDPDREQIDVEIMLYRPSREPTLAVALTVRLGDAIVATVTARPDRMVQVPIADAQRWSPARPVLYDLDVQLVRVPNPLPENERRATASLQREVPLRGTQEAQRYAAAEPVGAVIDSVHTYFGMRTITVGPHPESQRPALLLNGEPLFHLATLDQGWWPDGLHTPPADAALVYEISFLKAAGFNAVRKHIKIEPARYYYHCDRLGLLIWQDMPSGFLPAQFVAPNDEGEAIRTSVSTENYELELQRMIHHLRGHPSIVLWVLHNEGWGQFDTARLTARIKAMDPSRPVNAVSGWLDMAVGDVVDRHDYAPAPTAPAADGSRAQVIGEYGGIGLPITGHLFDPGMRTWGYQTFHNEADLAAAYAKTTAAIIRARRDGVCAAVYTQTTDVEGEVNGLITYDRRVEKLPRAWLAETHRDLT